MPVYSEERRCLTDWTFTTVYEGTQIVTKAAHERKR